MKYLFILLISLSISSAPPEKSNKVFVKEYFVDISKQGHAEALLQLPLDFKKRDKWPLIVNLHGYGGNLALQEVFTQFNHYINSMGFILLTPEGRRDSERKAYWNASPACCDFDNSGINDRKYIKELIDYIADHPKYGRIDMNRIYFFGHSNGGWLSYVMACEYPEYVTALASLGASMDSRDENGRRITELDPCPEAPPVAIMHIHGTKDRTVRAEGRDGFPDVLIGHVSNDELIQKWITHNNCEDSPASIRKVDASVYRKGKETTLTTYANCNNDVQVQFASIKGAKHIEFLKFSFYKRIVNFFYGFEKQ